MLPDSNGQHDYDGWSNSSGLSDSGSAGAQSQPQEPQEVEVLDITRLVDQFMRCFGEETFQQPDSSSQRLFQNLGQLICTGPEVTAWLASKQSDCFVLRLPPSLHNPLVVSGVAAGFLAAKPGPHLATTRPGPSQGAYSSGEFLLASLCDQWAKRSYTGDFSAQELKQFSFAFQGYNNALREKLLQYYFSIITTDGQNSGLAIVVDLSARFQGSHGLQQCLSTLERLLELAKDGDNIIRVLVILDTDEAADWSRPHTLTVDLNNKQVQESLVLDLTSSIDGTGASSRLLSQDAGIKETFLYTTRRHIHQPMLVFSYMQHLEACLWVTRSRIRTEADGGLLSSTDTPSGSPYFPFLGNVQSHDRAVVANILGFLDVSGRPMTMIELQTAAAMAQLPMKSDKFDDSKLVNIDFDVLHGLAGIAHIQNDRVVLLRQFGDNALTTPTRAASNLSWIYTRSDANKKLALTCLRYISLCSGKQVNKEGDDICEKWPFLQYAVTFWHYHYAEAFEKGVDDDVRQYIIENPGVVQAWLAFQDAADHSGLPVSKDREAESITAADTAALSADTMASKFDVSFPEAVLIAACASRIAVVMGGDTSTASIWSAWISYQRHFGLSAAAASTWLKKTDSTPNRDSLLKALPYAIEPTFQLLSQAEPEFVSSNAKDILDVAVRQGSTMVAERCFDLFGELVDSSLVCDLPINFCIWLGNETIFKKAFSHWRSPEDVAGAGDSPDVTTELSLLYRSMRYGRPVVFDVVLTWLLNFGTDVLASNRALDLVSPCGRAAYMVHLLTKAPSLVQLSSEEDISEVLRYAFGCNNVAIVAAMVDQEGFVREREENKNTPLLYAVRSQNLEMVKLLFDLKDGTDARKQLISDSSACIMKMGASDSTPLSESIANGSDDITAFLLEHSPPDAELADSLLLMAAAGSGRLATMKQVLEIKGMDVNLTRYGGLTALHLACRNGNLEVVQELLQHNANAWVPDDYGDPPMWELINNQVGAVIDREKTTIIAKELLKSAPEPDKLAKPLGDAAYQGYAWMVDILFDAGADKNARNAYARTPLHAAAYKGHEDVVRQLLQRQVELGPLDDVGDSPIKDAVTSQHTAVVKLLLDAGAGTNIDSDETTASDSLVGVAALRGNDSTLELLLERDVRLPLLEADSCFLELAKQRRTSALLLILKHQPEFRGQAVLSECAHIALRNSDVEMLALLFEHGGDPSVVSEQRLHGSALHECALYGNVKMARMLLDRPQARDDACLVSGQYFVPLVAAVSRSYSYDSPDDPRAARRLERQKAMIAFLVERGGSIKTLGGRMGSMLNAASSVGSPNLIKFVVRGLGLPVTLADKEGRTAAHLACTGRYYPRAKLEMLARLANSTSVGATALLRIADGHGRKPLHFACCSSNSEAIRYLMEDADAAGEDINCTDKDGWTPLHWACRQWDVLIVEALVSAGADKNARTARPIDVAQENATGKALWTPWDVALFHGNGTASFAEALGITDQPTTTGEPFCHPASCDSCFVSIYGIRHTCEMCGYFDICNKCVRWSVDFHDPKHTFRRQAGDDTEAEPADNEVPDASDDDTSMQDAGEE